MAFETYAPRTAVRRVFGPGQASLDAAGNLRVTRGDALAAGLGDAAFVTILLDVGTRRLALRAARDGEHGARFVARSRKGRDLARPRVGVRGALPELGFADPRQCFGIYDVTIKDDLLIVDLAGAATAASGGKRAAKRSMTNGQG